ncbi:MAG: hypothetical protein AB1640_12830 [bacterium]
MKDAKASVLSLILFLAVAVAPLAAQQTPPGGAVLSDEAIEQRLRFIQQRLDSNKRHGRIWYWSWMAINGGSAVGLGIAAGTTTDESTRVGYASKATLATIGVASLVFRPLQARHGADSIRGLPESTREEKAAKLGAAEDLLRSNAARAAERKSWVMHLGNVLLNTGAGVATGLAGDPAGGAIAAGTGVLSGTIFLLSQPAGPERDWEEYRGMASHRATERMQLSVQPARRGLQVQLRW